jgi:antitoxin MazE
LNVLGHVAGVRCNYAKDITVRTKIIRIGNSRGIRIPKPLLEHARLSDAVDVEFEDGALVIRCADSPRAGWDSAFARMAAAGDDALLDEGRHGATVFDDEEWEWT